MVTNVVLDRKKMSTNNRNSTGAGKKKGGGFLARHAKAKGGLSEADLLKKDMVTAEDVLKLSGITESKLNFRVFEMQNF